jgi:hypothetical protein
LKKCLDFFKKFLHFEKISNAFTKQEICKDERVSIRNVLEESNRTLLNCIAFDSKTVIENGDGLGILPSFLCPLLAHEAAIIGGMFVCNTDKWILRRRNEQMSHLIKEIPLRAFSLYDLIMKIINEESAYEFPESNSISDNLLFEYRKISMDRQLFIEILQSLDTTPVTREKDTRSGTWTIAELRQIRQRKTIFLADAKSTYTSVYAKQFECTDDSQCKKKVPQNPRNTSGIFIISCGDALCPCGNIVLAYYFMDHGESHVFFFNFIRERLPKKPKFI